MEHVAELLGLTAGRGAGHRHLLRHVPPRAGRQVPGGRLHQHRLHAAAAPTSCSSTPRTGSACAAGGTTHDGMFTLEDAECLAVCGNAPCVHGQLALRRRRRPRPSTPSSTTCGPAGSTTRSRPRHPGPGAPHRRARGATDAPRSAAEPGGDRPSAQAATRRLRPKRGRPAASEAGRDHHRRPRIVTSRFGRGLVDARVLPGDRRLRGPAQGARHDPRGDPRPRSTRPTSSAGAAPASRPVASGRCCARPSRPTWSSTATRASRPPSRTTPSSRVTRTSSSRACSSAAYAIRSTRSSSTSAASSPSASNGCRPRLNEAYAYGARRARTSSGPTSRSTSSSTPVPAPTSAARRRRCSRASRASAASRASSRRISRPPSASTARPPSSTTSRRCRNLPWIVINGGEAFAALGEGRSKGTKSVRPLGPRAQRPGNYELEMVKVTFRDLIYDPRLGGGIRDDNELKAFIPGGVSSPWFGPEHLDLPLANEVGEAGSMVGSGSVIVMDAHHLHGAGGVADHPLLPPGVLRPVHALPGGGGLAREDPGAHRERRRARSRPRPAHGRVRQHLARCDLAAAADDHLRARARRSRRRSRPASGCSGTSSSPTSGRAVPL